jgi:D-threo-aldose 1-dehydrogenase
LGQDGESDAARTIRHAYKAGIRSFDTAPQYGSGLSELRLGSVLRIVPRDSFVLSTKAASACS